MVGLSKYKQVLAVFNDQNAGKGCDNIVEDVSYLEARTRQTHHSMAWLGRKASGEEPHCCSGGPLVHRVGFLLGWESTAARFQIFPKMSVQKVFLVTNTPGSDTEITATLSAASSPVRGNLWQHVSYAFVYICAIVNPLSFAISRKWKAVPTETHNYLGIQICSCSLCSSLVGGARLVLLLLDHLVRLDVPIETVGRPPGVREGKPVGSVIRVEQVDLALLLAVLQQLHAQLVVDRIGTTSHRDLHTHMYSGTLLAVFNRFVKRYNWTNSGGKGRPRTAHAIPPREKECAMVKMALASRYQRPNKVRHKHERCTCRNDILLVSKGCRNDLGSKVGWCETSTAGTATGVYNGC